MPSALRPYRRVAVKPQSTLGRSPNLPIAYCWSFLALITLMLSCVGPAYAGWVSVVTKVEEGRTEYTVYVDQDSIHHNGDLVTFWILMDFTTPQTVPTPLICL